MRDYRQSSQLLIDAGSSRIKWAYWQGEKMAPMSALPHSAGVASVIEAIPKTDGLTQVLLSTVLDEAETEALSASIQSAFGVAPTLANSTRTSCGVVNAYEDVTQLGVDRWLAILAGWNRYHRPLVIVDCGTAVTLDAVDGAGHHLGGYILPSVRLMAESLVSGTRLRKPSDAVTTDLGRSTSECIAAGTRMAIVALIDGVVEKYALDNENHAAVLMTGGDADKIAPLLRSRVEVRPDLVLEGLAYWGGLITD